MSAKPADLRSSSVCALLVCAGSAQRDGLYRQTTGAQAAGVSGLSFERVDWVQTGYRPRPLEYRIESGGWWIIESTESSAVACAEAAS